MLPLVATQNAAAGSGVLALVLGITALAATCVVLAVWLVASRRRMSREIREVVQVVEEMRGGKVRRRPDIDRESPLGVVADAVQRLGHDLHGRWSEAEAAAERWRALIDASEDIAVITTDTDGDIRSFSTGATGLFGWDEEEVASRPAAVIFEESAYKDLLPKLARRELRKQGVTTHSKLMRRDGSSFDAEVAIRLLTGASGQPVGFMMVVRDITAQLTMERNLRDSESRYRSLVEGLGEGMLIVRDGRVAYANPAAEALCQRSANELVGTPWRDCVSTPDVLVADEVLRGVETGVTPAAELRCTLVGSDRTPRAEVRILARAVDFESQPAVLLLVQDETAERQGDAELRRNEARLDAVLEATSDGILVVSDGADGRVVQMTNTALAEMFGVRLEQLLGRDAGSAMEAVRRGVDGGDALARWIVDAPAVATGATVMLGGDSPREVHVNSAPLWGADGQRLGQVVAFRDVTDQRRSERELQQQTEKLESARADLERSYRRLNDVNDQLQRRGADLERLNGELQRLDEMKSNLLGNVSHELQTPLVSIRGYTEMILKERMGPISEDQRKGLKLSLKNIDRLIAMIDNLLAFSRKAREARLRLTRFSLLPVIEEARDLLREQLAARRIHLTLRVDPENVQVEGDRDKVLQVFVNLLSNAVKFNREDGSIDVSCEARRSGSISVRVSDTGVGIARDDLSRIFERGYRGEQTGEAGDQGSGIGLAIVHDILRLHGCTIHADSEPGRGSEFTFTLPLADSDAPDPEERGLESGSTAPPEASVTAAHPLPQDPPSATPPEAPEPESGAPLDDERLVSGDEAVGEPAPRLRIIRRYRSDG